MEEKLSRQEEKMRKLEVNMSLSSFPWTRDREAVHLRLSFSYRSLVLWNRNYFLRFRFRFRLLKSSCCDSDFDKLRLWFRFTRRKVKVHGSGLFPQHFRSHHAFYTNYVYTFRAHSRSTVLHCVAGCLWLIVMIATSE
jgi:hypothetical protein